MAYANYKVTITDHDYWYTTYVAYVSASSKNQAMVKAAALAGAEKARREYERMPHRGVSVEGLIEPDVRLESVDLDEFWENRETVQVSSELSKRTARPRRIRRDRGQLRNK